jgi:DNA-binding transcriptional regulator YiaG
MTNHEIKELREALKLSTQQLANKIGVSRYTINRWESGESRPQPRSAKMLEKLSKEVRK